MELFTIKKVFTLNLILFILSIFYLSKAVCLSNVVFAESFDSPKIEYSSTIEEFDGKKIKTPSNIYIDSYDEMYILDSKTKTIYILSNLLRPSAMISQDQGLFSPFFITVSKDGEVYALEIHEKGKSSYISVFNFNRRKIKTIKFKGFKGAETFIPNSMAIDKNKKIYLSGYTQPGVVVLDEKGNFLTEIVTKDNFGDKKPEPVVIRDIAIDKECNLYLLSEAMGKVYVYNQKFELLFEFGKKGGVPGSLSRPRGIAIDQKGRAYITDYMRHCVNIYDSDGTYLSEFGGKGISHGWFNYPQDIAISKNNILAVADLFNKRVELFKIID